MPEMTGGCLCGQARYSANADPVFVGVCHCKNCQKQTGASRSRARALRSCRASCAGDAVWPGRPHGSLVVSVFGTVVARYADTALADSDSALKDAHEIGQAATLMYALVVTSLNLSIAETTQLQRRNLMKLAHWRTKRASCSGRRSV